MPGSSAYSKLGKMLVCFLIILLLVTRSSLYRAHPPSNAYYYPSKTNLYKNTTIQSLAGSSYPSYPIFNTIRRNHSSLIPNLILRTWKTNNRIEIEEMSRNGSDHPDRFRWFNTWKKMNPSATQIIFNDNDMDRFVIGSFSKRVADAYFKLPRIVLRADFTRYMMLYELGGVYADMDVSCKKPIQLWNLGFPQVAVIVGVEDPGYGNYPPIGKNIDSVQQWAMACARHHPFMAKVIDRVTENIHALSEQELLNADVLELTGPGVWKKVVWEHIQSIGGNLEKDRNLWTGYHLYGDFLLLGKSFLNADQQHHPDALISHHFTGFTKFGWRNQGAAYENQTRLFFAKQN